ncbi:hypothetical protein D3C76_1020380 [compost metagenome]
MGFYSSVRFEPDNHFTTIDLAGDQYVISQMGDKGAPGPGLVINQESLCAIRPVASGARGFVGTKNNLQECIGLILVQKRGAT